MGQSAGLMRTWSRGRLSIAFGTAIEILVPPRKGAKTKITKCSVTVAGTAHTLTCLRPLGKTTLTADVAAAATPTLILANDPGLFSVNNPNGSATANNGLANADRLCIQRQDGTFTVLTVNVVTTNADGTVSMSITQTISNQKLAKGANVWFFGVSADVDPRTGEAHPVFTLPASATTVLEALEASVVETLWQNEPILMIENNITATATVEYVQAVYGP